MIRATGKLTLGGGPTLLVPPRVRAMVRRHRHQLEYVRPKHGLFQRALNKPPASPAGLAHHETELLHRDRLGTDGHVRPAGAKPHGIADPERATVRQWTAPSVARGTVTRTVR